MRRLVIASLFVLMTARCASAPRGFALTNVNVVDVAANRVVADRTVVVTGTRITAVGPSNATRLPRGVRTIELRGRFVMPGLWDMHAHLWDHEATPALFIANGVTGVRDMGSDVTATVALREAVARGERIGPRIVTAGLVLDGPREEAAPHRLIVGSVDDVLPALERLRRDGADFLKVYHFLSRETYLRIGEEARGKLDVAGHLPAGVTLEDAVRAGQRSVEHLYGIREAMLRGDGAAIDAAARVSVDGGLWHTPTVAHYRSVAFRDTPDDPYVPDPLERYLTPSMREFWDRYMPRREVTEAQARARAEAFRNLQAGVLRFHRAGVRMLAGSDNGIRYVYPGFGLHDELAQLVACGLTPAEALRMATTNAAEYLRLESGAVAAGLLADLLVLDADPLADVANVRRIHAVVANGRLLDRAALDAQLASAAAAAR